MNFESKLRRRLLLSGGSALALLPWLEVFTGGRLNQANAQTQSPIKRFMVFFYPGGVIREKFWPTGTETGFTMPYILEPLTPYRDKLLIMDGLNQLNMLDGVGHPHTRGMCGLLTGKATVPGPYAFFLGGSTDFAQAASIDHMIGNKISAGLRFPTLELGVLWPTYGTGPSPQNTISYSGAGQPAQPMADPWKAFQRIFAGVSGSGNGMSTDAALRQKEAQLVLDSAAAEFNALTVTIVLSLNIGGVHKEYGIVVDSVRDVVDLAPGCIRAAPDVGGARGNEFIEAIATHEEQMLILLDAESLAAPESSSPAAAEQAA